ncbi:MAG TPA: hypothetical protein V6D19_12405, partial [Stenomitos sp.]
AYRLGGEQYATFGECDRLPSVPSAGVNSQWQGQSKAVGMRDQGVRPWVETAIADNKPRESAAAHLSFR